MPLSVATTTYTLCSANNAFTHEINPMLGFLDSTVSLCFQPTCLTSLQGMLVALLAFMFMSFGLTGGAFSTLIFALGCLPFVLDGGVNLIRLALPWSSRNDENEEGQEYQKMSDSEDKNFVDASDRILPRSLRDNTITSFLLTRNWKDNASNTEDNSTPKQLTAFTMLVAYLLLGGAAVASGSQLVGTVSLAYAGSGLAQYLGARLPPVLRAMSVNAVSGLGAIFGLGAMATGGVSLTLLMLTALHIIDLVCGVDESREADLDNMRSAGESVGPLTHFFTTSWKSNSFNKNNFLTCQTT